MKGVNFIFSEEQVGPDTHSIVSVGCGRKGNFLAFVWVVAQARTCCRLASSTPARCISTHPCPGHNPKHFSPKTPLCCRLYYCSPQYGTSPRGGLRILARLRHGHGTSSASKHVNFLTEAFRYSLWFTRFSFLAPKTTGPSQMVALSAWVSEWLWYSEPQDRNVAWMRNKLCCFKLLGACLLLQHNLAYYYPPITPPAMEWLVPCPSALMPKQMVGKPQPMIYTSQNIYSTKFPSSFLIHSFRRENNLRFSII